MLPGKDCRGGILQRDRAFDWQPPAEVAGVFYVGNFRPAWSRGTWAVVLAGLLRCRFLIAAEEEQFVPDDSAARVPPNWLRLRESRTGCEDWLSGLWAGR